MFNLNFWIAVQNLVFSCWIQNCHIILTVLISVSAQFQLFWVVQQRSVGGYYCFRVTCCLHLHCQIYILVSQIWIVCIWLEKVFWVWYCYRLSSTTLWHWWRLGMTSCSSGWLEWSCWERNSQDSYRSRWCYSSEQDHSSVGAVQLWCSQLIGTQ